MRLPAPVPAVAAMLSVQLGAASSTHLFAALTPAGSAWLRLAVAALVLLAVARPRRRDFSRSALRGTLLLGAATGLMTLAFVAAMARLPLGTAVAIEFLGPLGVAAARAHRRSALAWPALALVGVLGLTEPWNGTADLVGIGFAAAAAAGWAGYLVLTQRIGAEVEGVRGIAVSLAVSAVVTAPIAAWPALTGLTPAVALAGVGVAVLVPLLPYVLELAALRRMTLTAFGTLMAVEPALATVLGLVLLAQAPAWPQVLGVTLVVLAGIGAQRTTGTPAPPMPAPAPAPAADPAQRRARTVAASSAGSVVGWSQTKPRQTYAAGDPSTGGR